MGTNRYVSIDVYRYVSIETSIYIDGFMSIYILVPYVLSGFYTAIKAVGTSIKGLLAQKSYG